MAFRYTGSAAPATEAIMKAFWDAEGRINNKPRFEGQRTEVWKCWATLNQYRLSGYLEWRGQFLWLWTLIAWPFEDVLMALLSSGTTCLHDRFATTQRSCSWLFPSLRFTKKMISMSFFCLSSTTAAGCWLLQRALTGGYCRQLYRWRENGRENIWFSKRTIVSF